MDLGISQRTALVLGAGGGLGSAIARTLGREGANVALGDVAEDALRETKALVEGCGVEALALKWDLADLSIIDENVQSIERTLGPVEILVNITGGPPPTPVVGQESSAWLAYFKSMVVSVIAITDRILPGMREQGWGRVITSTSSGVVTPIPNLGLSNSLRSSLVGWSKTLSNEVASDGVTVNTVVPGRIATGRIRALDEAKAERQNISLEQVVAESTGNIPVQRYGDPQEYADVVAFLASVPASYVNGSIVRVDGGLIPSV